eukprot:4909632-Pleurochrysis_carterae.AAC.1
MENVAHDSHMHKCVITSGREAAWNVFGETGGGGVTLLHCAQAWSGASPVCPLNCYLHQLYPAAASARSSRCSGSPGSDDSIFIPTT